MASFDGHAILIGIWVLWSLCTVFIGLRFYCKASRHAKIALDDWVLFVAWLATLTNCILNTVDIRTDPPGLPGPDYVNKVAIIQLLSVTFAITGQSLSKVSFGITLLNICTGWLRWFILIAIALINILFGLGGLFFWIACTPLHKTWQPMTEGTCWPASFHVNFGIFVSAFSGVMDLCFALIPWKIILALQMNKREKLGVAFAMSLGTIAAVTAFIKCDALRTLAPGERPGTMLVMFGVAEPALTIVAASVPFLRVLVKHVVSSRDRYHLSDMGGTNRNRHLDGTGNSSKRNQASVTASSSHHRSHHNLEGADARSDKSILGDSNSNVAGPNGIVHTKMFEVSYESRDSGSNSDGVLYDTTGRRPGN